MFCERMQYLIPRQAAHDSVESQCITNNITFGKEISILPALLKYMV